MPDPAWTEDYNINNSPEENGFTRILTGSPTILEQTTGNPNDRRLEITSDNGEAVFTTSSVPSLDMTVGATLEAVGLVSGVGDAGFELTFLDLAILVNVMENSVNLSIPPGTDAPGGAGNFVDGQEIVIATAPNNVKTTWRVTIDSARDWRVYRDVVLVAGPIATHFIVKPFQRILFWGEGGGTQSFYDMKYFIGGSVVPGP